MKYSFIIPVCDDTRVINTIQSFLDCSGSDQCECLVVCNGSSNKTRESLLNSFAKNQNIRIIYTKKKNISLARNLGVLQAMGDFLIYIDSDCVFGNGYLEILKGIHHNQDVIRGKTKYHLGKTMFDKNYAWIREYFNNTFTTNLYTPNLIVRKSLYNAIGLYNEDLSGSEDTEWSQRFYEHNQFTVEYAPSLFINHGLDNPKKSHKTWISYGLGQAYRAKKAMLLNNQPLRASLSKAFSELTLIDVNQPLSRNLFILRYVFFKSLGFAYGWIIKWGGYTKQKYVAIENYYKSEDYKSKIIKSTNNVE